MANSRAKAIDDAEGFVKILADEQTDKVLEPIIGPHAGELIAEIGMEFGASSEDIARTCHMHPTFSEAVKEAALSVDKSTTLKYFNRVQNCFYNIFRFVCSLFSKKNFQLPEHLILYP